MGEDLGGRGQSGGWLGHLSKTLRVREDKNRQRGNGRGGSFQASQDSGYILACAEPLEMEVHSFTHSLVHSTFPSCCLCAGTEHATVNMTG